MSERISCPNCGHAYGFDEKRVSCPYCGHIPWLRIGFYGFIYFIFIVAAIVISPMINSPLWQGILKWGGWIVGVCGLLWTTNVVIKAIGVTISRSTQPKPKVTQRAEPSPKDKTTTKPAHNLLMCPECGLPFKTKYDLQTHIANWHPAVPVSKKETRSERITCPTCGLPFKTKTDLQTHIANWHPSVTVPEKEARSERILCPTCGVEVNRQITRCVVCGTKLRKEEEVPKHRTPQIAGGNVISVPQRSSDELVQNKKFALNNLPRKTLIEIVRQQGISLCEDPRRCEGFLMDYCGEHRREIYVLVAALEERVAADLIGSQGNVPQEVLWARLSKRLMDDLAMAEDAARWAVESWALALGGISGMDLKKRRVRKKEPKAAREDRPNGGEVIAHAEREMRITLSRGVHMFFMKVARGLFLMGSDKKVDKWARIDEIPQHEVYLDEYWIGKYPVTNRQYQVFIETTNHNEPEHWEGGGIPKRKEEHPVCYITWSDADAFCKWLSDLIGRIIRLPSEAEWEKAARGTDGRIWPWGDRKPNARLCTWGSQVHDTMPVGAYSPNGDSHYGCADMAGNVWEWVADWYKKEYYNATPFESPRGPSSGRRRVIRGGSWKSGYKSFLRAARREAFNEARYPHNDGSIIGFRCACDAPP